MEASENGRLLTSAEEQPCEWLLRSDQMVPYPGPKSDDRSSCPMQADTPSIAQATGKVRNAEAAARKAPPTARLKVTAVNTGSTGTMVKATQAMKPVKAAAPKLSPFMPAPAAPLNVARYGEIAKRALCLNTLP